MLQCFANQNARVYSKHGSLKIMKIPTKKGEHSCKCKELKRENCVVQKGAD